MLAAPPAIAPRLSVSDVVQKHRSRYTTIVTYTSVKVSKLRSDIELVIISATKNGKVVRREVLTDRNLRWTTANALRARTFKHSAFNSGICVSFSLSYALEYIRFYYCIARALPVASV